MTDTPTSITAAVLVHGAWHGAWTYERIVPLLAAHGVFAVARDLPAHGLNARFPAGYTTGAWSATSPSPAADVTLDDYVDSVVDTVAHVRALGFERLMLVGHSMGGIVVSAVAERVPEWLSRIVYLTAFMPATGVPAVTYIDAPENAGERVGGQFVADPRAVGALRIDHRSRDAAYLAQTRAAFFGDVDEASWQAVSQLLTPDVPAAPMATPIALSRDRWGALPRHYIHCLRDEAIRPALQRRFIAEADACTPGNRTVVHTLDTSHSPFLSQPGRLAELLADIARH